MIKVKTTYINQMAGRKKQNRTSLHARVGTETPSKIKEIAEKLGYL